MGIIPVSQTASISPHLPCLVCSTDKFTVIAYILLFSDFDRLVWQHSYAQDILKAHLFFSI